MTRLRDRPLLRNIFSGGVAAILNAILTALSVRIFLGALGMERYGVWATLTSVVSLIQLSSFGISPALTTRAAELEREGQFSELERTLGAAQFAVFTLGFVFVVTGIAAALPIARFLGLTEQHLLEGAESIPWVCVLATLSLNAQLTSSTLIGLGRADVVALQSTMGKVLQIALSAALLRQGLGVKAVIWGNAIATMIQALAGELVLRRMCRVAWSPWSRPHFATLRPVYRLGASLALSSSFQLGLAPFGKWLLAHSLGLGMVSIYEIGWSVAMHVRVLASTAFQSTVREFAHHRAHPERTRRLLMKSYRAMALIFTPVFLVTGIALPWLLNIWLGPSFSPALIGPTRVFLFSSWMGMFGIPGYYCLLGEGRARALVYSQAIQASLNITSSVLLWMAFPYSPSLAALAMCTAAFGTMIYCVWVTWRGPAVQRPVAQ